MDNERYRIEYNGARETCLLKKGDSCGIKIEGTKFTKIIYGDCIEDDYKTCPLFTFIKNTPGKIPRGIR